MPRGPRGRPVRAIKIVRIAVDDVRVESVPESAYR